MDEGIDANVPLDYIEFHVFPSQGRYEATICLGNNCEVAASGSLEPLVFHSPQIKAFYSEGSDGKTKLVSSEDVNGSRWFTKSTVLRFLQIISSPEVLDATTGLRNEISQLEEARSFHLTLYGKGSRNTYDGEVTDYNSEAEGCRKDTTDTTSSDDSKNELLRAMYLRITVLRGELSHALAKSAAITFSRDKITDIKKFCFLFGAIDLRKSFCNLVEVGPENGTEPKKASAEICESGESSDSIVEEEQSVERSRPLIRLVSPRRSASSPMRSRVQIGRSGSRRSTPLTIKSLHYFPKERLVSQNEVEVEVEVEHSDGEDEADQPSKKSVSNNARRISVQDAISLFESKQRETSGVQKTNSFTSGSNKSVLRRWSSVTGEGSRACLDTSGSDNSVQSVQSTQPESKQEHDLSTGHDEVQPTDQNECQKSENNVGCCEENDTPPSKSLGINENKTVSAEWSRQKEAEHDQLLMKMMETKSVKYTNTSQDNRKSLNGPGGKKDEKLRRENAGKQADMAKKQSFDERKSVMDPTKRIHGGNKHNANSLKSKRTLSPSPDAAKEITKPSVFSKSLPKTSSLPATRKSWPSAPSPRTTVISTAKTLPETASSGITTRRKSQPTSPATTLSSKMPVPKSLKATQSDKGKVVNNMNINKQQPTEKNPKSTKAKAQNPKSTKAKAQNPINDSTLAENPSLYSKVTKKSSVVPLEPKPLIRKGSKGVSSVSRTKVSSQTDESSNGSKDQMLPAGNEIISASLKQEVDLEPLDDHLVSDPEFERRSPEKSEDLETHLPEKGSFLNTEEVSSNNEVVDELTIPPTAWVDKEEHEDHEHGDSICQVELESSPNIAPARMPSIHPRVRHSLSQMLLEEISEPDVNEWGNADNPPTIVLQKDAPKGFKKLLKFARKSKTDGNSTGLSEGEDDAEETKYLGKIATLHGKSNGFAPKSFFSLSAFGSGK